MGPWWMTVKKLEADLRGLAREVTATGEAHPKLTEAPALTGAEAAVARASIALRRVNNSTRTEPADELLRKASAAVDRADEAVQRARTLALMASRAKSRRVIDR
jgi:hypothetical protein